MATDSLPPDPDMPDPQPSDPEFRFVLQSLVDAYRPILEEDLKRAGDLDALAKEADTAPPDCEAELAAAERLFKGFVDEKVAMALLPAQARELLGPVDRWRWCLLHIRCCIVFGWLLCRRPRSFRLSAYYLYRYWLCVRRVLGTPVTPGQLTAAEQKDLATLVDALARAYKPYLADELATVDFTAGLPAELDHGEIDCHEGEEESVAVFERLLTVDTAQALLGAEAFKQHSSEPWFWFCRCWCLCAIRFGCCLARARSLVDVLRCLRFYWRCIRECFRPLTCALTGPEGCVAEQVEASIPALVVPIIGTAAGVGFTHYVLEWSKDNISWHASDFVYPPVPPGNPVQGNSAVVGGLLAYLNTTLLDAGTYFVRMKVHGSGNATSVCAFVFSVFKKDVRILGVASNTELSLPWADPAARLVDHVPALCTRPAGTFEASFGGSCLQVLGAAYVGGCDDNRRIKRYTLDYKPGFETDCNTAGWSNFWAVDYSTAAQLRAVNLRTDTSVLTAYWGPDCLVPVPFPPWCLLNDPLGRLYPGAWNTLVGGCQLSGLFTLRLTVEDTLGGSYCDTQRVWLDNRPITARILIDAVPKCADLFVSQFANPPDCSVPWSLPVAGIAYDEYIDETMPLTRPNDNFDYYVVTVAKQGGPSITIPVPGPGGPCFHGTQRVGDPGTRCGVPTVPQVIGTLAQFDLRAIDLICKSSMSYAVPDAFTTPRGECCVYTFHLTVYDRTARPCGISYATAIWPVKICNDLRPG
ncbi:MAG: hypothetical protein OEU93_01245 [Rubrivivax sp.]|nr:hypothetical protein [Rubrivivax sp.]